MHAVTGALTDFPRALGTKLGCRDFRPLATASDNAVQHNVGYVGPLDKRRQKPSTTVVGADRAVVCVPVWPCHRKPPRLGQHRTLGNSCAAPRPDRAASRAGLGYRAARPSARIRFSHFW